MPLLGKKSGLHRQFIYDRRQHIVRQMVDGLLRSLEIFLGGRTLRQHDAFSALRDGWKLINERFKIVAKDFLLQGSEREQRIRRGTEE